MNHENQYEIVEAICLDCGYEGVYFKEKGIRKEDFKAIECSACECQELREYKYFDQ